MYSDISFFVMNAIYQSALKLEEFLLYFLLISYFGEMFVQAFSSVFFQAAGFPLLI